MWCPGKCILGIKIADRTKATDYGLGWHERDMTPEIQVEYSRVSELA